MEKTIAELQHELEEMQLQLLRERLRRTKAEHDLIKEQTKFDDTIKKLDIIAKENNETNVQLKELEEKLAKTAQPITSEGTIP